MKTKEFLLLFVCAVSAYSCGVCLHKKEVALSIEGADKRRNAVLFAVEDSLKAFSSLDGGEVASYTGFFSPYFVCGSRGKYVRLYGYSQENLLKKFVKDKKQIKGWIKRSDMVDIESASLMKKRYLLAVNDYSLLLEPHRYFVNEDSVWLYNSSRLKVTNGKIPLYRPVFLIKHSDKDSSSLVAESPAVPFPYSDLNGSGRWLSRVKIGWVSDKLLSPPVCDSVKKIALRDSANIKIPWGVNSFLTLKESDSVFAKRLNIVIVLPPEKCRQDNRAQMLKLFGESKHAICRGVKDYFGSYSISYVAVEANNKDGNLLKLCKSNDSTAFFDAVAVYLSKNGTNATSIQDDRMQADGISICMILNMLRREHIVNVSNGGNNLVIIIGSSARDDKGCMVEDILNGCNINLLSCQIAENSSRGNRSFVIQSSNVIRKYAALSTCSAVENRLFYIVPGGDSLLHKQSIMREFEADLYLLDFPKNSFAVGGVVYPGLHKSLSGGKLYKGIEIILEQMSMRHRMIERVVERGFKMPELCKGERMKDSTLFPDVARAFFGKSQLYAYF